MLLCDINMLRYEIDLSSHGDVREDEKKLVVTVRAAAAVPEAAAATSGVEDVATNSPAGGEDGCQSIDDSKKGFVYMAVALAASGHGMFIALHVQRRQNSCGKQHPRTEQIPSRLTG